MVEKAGVQYEKAERKNMGFGHYRAYAHFAWLGYVAKREYF